MFNRKKKLGEILIETAGLEFKYLQIALDQQRMIKTYKKDDKRIGEILLKNKLISENQLYYALAIQFQIPWFEKLTFQSPIAELKCVISEVTAREHKIVPVEVDKDLGGNTIVRIAIYNPLDLHMFDKLRRFLFNCQIEPIMSSKSEVLSAIQNLYSEVVEDDLCREIPELLKNLIEDAIGKNAVKLSLSYAQEESDFIERINIEILNKYDFHKSECAMFDIGTYKLCIEELKRNFGIGEVSGVKMVEIPFVDNGKPGRPTMIVFYSGNKDIRLDVYMVYDDKQDIRDSIDRTAELLRQITNREKWSRVASKANLLQSLGGLEEMLKGWLVENGVEE